MNKFPFESGSAKSFDAYPRGDFDLESGTIKGIRKPKSPPLYLVRMIKSLGSCFRDYYRMNPVVVFFITLFLGLSLLMIVSMYGTHYRLTRNYQNLGMDSESYPLSKLRNLVMVAGHSVYTSSGCGKVDKEDSWFLELYQKHPGQASTFVAHIQEGIEIAAKDDAALLLFSGGETRKDAGPRSEAQSYWIVAESKEWFGHEEEVRSRALTEEHARDSFENLLFSVCRFRELTGTYPTNITVVSYDFKEERFAHLHRSAIRFPDSRFFYFGTPASTTSREAALKGEALVRAQFEKDPYGCHGSLNRKKLQRNPFHRSVPYPNGCPEIEGLFRYCGKTPYPDSLPWV